MGWKASCTWGDGPDVLVTLQPDSYKKGSRFNQGFVLYEDPILKAESNKDGMTPPQRGRYLHGAVESGSFDLTADQALELAASLTQAARAAKSMDESYERYCAFDKGDNHDNNDES